jgi:predicted ATP-dependent endonuclease of OLD family
MEITKLYLKEVSLSGYKSINDVNISFKKGLNIIIGKNAAGKTNFLSFLNKVLLIDYKNLLNFSALLLFKNKNEIKLFTRRSFKSTNSIYDLGNNSKLNFNLEIDNKEIDFKNQNILQKFSEEKILYNVTFITHGIPTDYLIVDKPLNIEFYTNDLISNDLYNIIDSDSPVFLKNFAIDLSKLNSKIGNFEIQIKNLLNGISDLKYLLCNYSPIDDIRFSDNYNFFTKDNSITINNLFLEFKIDDYWLPFSNLSDGTKRIFYILSETFDFEFIKDDNSIRNTISDGITASTKDISRIILIEEPELGIHPHQFHQLMQFLKIESENKQIIITTHSPKALDVLNKEELDRVIIASINNSKVGTKLNHLNEQQIEKAKMYMKEDYLSDYWLYSDLER